MAKAQKLVVLSVLFQLLLIPFNLGLGFVFNPVPAWAGIVYLILALSTLAFGVFAMFRLASTLRGNVAAIFYAIFTVIPCLSLILLLVLNQEATQVIKRKNIKVGLMGANLNDLQ